MKKFLSVLLTLVLALSLFPAAALGATVVDSGACGEYLTWTLDSDGTLTISGTGNMTNASYKTNSASQTDNKPLIKKVIIEDGVTTLISAAFEHCTNLKTVSLGNTLKVISWCAFNDTGLESISIPASVERIEDKAFLKTPSLTMITVAPANAYYSSENNVLFSKDKTVLIRYPSAKTDASYTIPATVKTLGNSSFNRCTKLTAVTVPEGVTDVGEGVFGNCTGLRTASLPDSLTYLNTGMFNGCTALTSVTLGNNVKDIYQGAFGECSSLDGLILPGSLQNFVGNGGKVFFNCSSLSELTIPYGPTKLVFFSLGGCSGLRSLTLPASFLGIGSSLFDDCDSLEELYVYGKNTSVSLTNVPSTAKIYGFNGSAAQTFAENNSLTFIPLDGTHTHSYTCNKVTPAKCTVNGEIKSYCLCGEYTTQVINAPGHTWDEGEITKPATCVAMGETTYTCTVPGCGATETRTDVQKNPDNHVNTVEAAETNSTCIAHGYTAGVWCNDCETWVSGHEEKTFVDHVWSETGTVTKPATCSEKGETTYTCTVPGCEATDVRTDVEKNSENHADYGTEVENAAPAYCYRDGYTGDTVCARCRALLTPGETISKDTVPHAWDEGTVTLKPTCSTTGTMLYRCTVKSCGATKEEEIKKDPDAHVFRTDVIPPTCTDDGYTSYACTLCRYGYAADEQPALGHRWSAPVWSWSGTSSASATFTCANGDHPVTVAATLTSETVKAPTDTEAGKTVYTATAEFEGETYTNTVEKSIPALNDGLCKWCGERHEGFFGRILGFFHSVAYFFAHLFGRK